MAVVSLCLATLLAYPALALPPGRAWMPTEGLVKPGFLYLAGPRLETDTSGVPLAFAAAVFGPTGDAIVGYQWTGVRWAEIWQFDREPGYLWPVLAPWGQQHLVWVDYAPVPERPGPYARLFMAQVMSDGVGPIDTVAIVHDKTVMYAAAVSARRRWVLAKDPLSGLHLFYSDKPHMWGELPVFDSGSEGVAVTALDDTAVLVAAASLGGPISWGIVRGSTWIGGAPPIPDNYAYGPVLRPRPSGGQWLAWPAVDEHVTMMSYRGGLWSAPESLRCAYRTSGQHFSNSVSLSRDRGEYPAVAWSSEVSGSMVVCACMPADSAYGLADEMEGGYTDGIPSVALDANGDVWVAWWAFFRGMYWTHTYTSAGAGAPRVAGAGRHRVVTWALSEPAPGSWWTVQRAGRHGPRRPAWHPRAWEAEVQFEDVARLRAGEGVEMSWTDDTPPAGVLRYRIRRDCVDRRYEWLSEEATWPPHSFKPRPIRLVARGVGGDVELEGAVPGTFEVLVYDVQGRLVHQQEEVSAAGETRVFRVGLARASSLPSGIYFVQVRDGLGRESNPAKTVYLR